MTPEGDDDKNPPGDDRNQRNTGIVREEESSTVPANDSPGETSPERTREGVMAVSVRLEGPLPPPGLLRQYDEVVPGLASQIAEQARVESDRLHEFDGNALKATIKDKRRGQWTAFIVLMGILAVSAFAIAEGMPWVAGIALSVVGGAGGVVGFHDLIQRRKRE